METPILLIVLQVTTAQVTRPTLCPALLVPLGLKPCSAHPTIVHLALRASTAGAQHWLHLLVIATEASSATVRLPVQLLMEHTLRLDRALLETIARMELCHPSSVSQAPSIPSCRGTNPAIVFNVPPESIVKLKVFPLPLVRARLDSIVLQELRSPQTTTPYVQPVHIALKVVRRRFPAQQDPINQTQGKLIAILVPLVIIVQAELAFASVVPSTAFALLIHPPQHCACPEPTIITAPISRLQTTAPCVRRENIVLMVKLQVNVQQVTFA